MDSVFALQKSLELCRDPALVLRNGSVLCWNAQAAVMLPGIAAEASGVSWLPGAALRPAEEDYLCLADVEGWPCAIRVLFADELRLVCLRREDGEASRGFLSDGVLTNLQSSLFCAQLALKQLGMNSTLEGEEMAILRRSCFSLQRQIGNLQTAAALHEGEISVCLQMLDLRQCLEEICRAVRDAMENGPNLRFVSGDEPVYARMDLSLLYRIALNLLSNSYQHTPQEEEITVTLETEGEFAVLRVSDRGEGIPPERMDTVFNRYVLRATPEDLSPAASGGLGLYISSMAARRLGGTLMLTSRPSKGTTVTVSLPLNQNRGSLAAAERTTTGLDLCDQILTEFSGLMGLEHYALRLVD